jgi:hypothetical protein
VCVETNTASVLGDHGADLEGVVDALNAVILHVDEEAGRQLSVRCSCTEEGGGGVCEVFVGHVVVGLDSGLDVAAVDANSDTHDHVLRSLGDFAVDAEEV